MSTHRSAVRRTITPAGLAAYAFVAASACLFVVLAAAVIFLRPSISAAPTGTAATVGELRYSVNNAWVLHPRRPAEAGLARGLPSVDAKLGRHQLLYAVFLGVTNETDRRLPMATSFALRDTRNREYSPTSLGPRNAFAYRPGLIAPQTHRPAPWTSAGRYLSADGLMLVFRITRRSYDDGPLELVVHDPLHPATVRTIQTA
jgi:hypothetical protein